MGLGYLLIFCSFVCQVALARI